MTRDPYPEMHECETTDGWTRAMRTRVLDDGRMLALEPLIFDAYRLHVVRNPFDLGSMEIFDYQDDRAAIDALFWWDGEGEPEGWYRHRPSNRRRPDGDAEREYVVP